MSERAAHILVGDMLAAVERIRTYTDGMDFGAFIADEKTVDLDDNCRHQRSSSLLRSSGG